MKPTGEEGFLTTGNGWLALFKGEKPGLHHYCYSIANYDPADALARLKAAGLAPKRRGDHVYFDDARRHRMPGRERVITPEPPLAAPTTSSQHVHAVRPRKDKRGVDLISDALPFGRLWLRRTVAAVRFI